MKVKAGARHSKRDMELLQELSDLGKKAGEVAERVQGIVVDLGWAEEAEEEAEESTEEQVEPAAEEESEAPEEAAEAPEPSEGKALKTSESVPAPVEPEVGDFAIKALGGNRIGMYAILYGDEKNRDLSGEYFTPKTDSVDHIFKAVGALPLLYHHGRDEVLKSTVIGKVDVLVSDDNGWWAEAQLWADGQSTINEDYQAYVREIRKLIANNKLGTSSGTLPGARKATKGNGQITDWPMVELSLTPTPCEPQTQERTISFVKSAFEEAGLQFPIRAEEAPEAEAEKAPGGAEKAQEDEAAAKAAIERELANLLELEVSLES